MGADGLDRPETGQFGHLLRQYRIAAALSQEALAERAGISARAVSDLERGIKTRPHLETIRLLVDALALNPAERVALAAAARPGTASAARAHHSPQTTPKLRLPIPPTPLVGRNDDIRSIVDLLTQDETRLMTLTGPGGVGKTRLALAATAALEPAFADGAVWVELAPVADPTLVPVTVAHALGITVETSTPIAEALRSRLREQRVLLALDNCEHLREAVSTLAAELLPACPRLLILATSRARLRLAAEQVVPVEPLAVPEEADEGSVDQVIRADAVTLFVQHARAARADFTLTGDNAPDVAALCRRLDGLPLAIELAAARVRILSPAALRALLDERLRLLTGGAVDAPARHQTLEATLAWSYDLLESGPQATFRALSACAGGCTFDTAAAITAHDDPFAALDDIEALVEQNLLRAGDGPDGEFRYAMLETVRDFARARLAEDPEATTIRGRHATHFVEMAEQGDAALSGSNQATWLRRLDADRDNLREAMTWLLASSQQADLLRLASALWTWWSRRGSFEEGRSWLERALALGKAEPVIRAKSYHRLGNLGIDLGDYPMARIMYEASLDVARAIDDRHAIAAALNGLGIVATDTGAYDESRTLHQRALAIRRDLRDTDGEARSLFNLGYVAAQSGNLADARWFHEEALAIERSQGHLTGEAYLSWAIAHIDIREGNTRAAGERLAMSLALFRELGDQLGIGHVLTEQGSLAQAEGEPLRSLPLLLAALDIRARAGDRLGVVICLERISSAAARLDMPRQAALLLGATAAQRQTLGTPLSPYDQSHIELVHCKIGESICSKELDIEFEHGRTLSIADAVSIVQRISDSENVPDLSKYNSLSNLELER